MRPRFALMLPMIAVAVLSPERSIGDPRPCDGQPAIVEAEDRLAGLVCKTIERTSRFLAECGLAVTEPVSIMVSDDMPADAGACFGQFECAESEIRLRTPEGMAELASSSSLFAGFGREQLFESIVAHEWAHAAFDDTACAAARCVENHEYIASVAQMWSLPADRRESVLSAYPAEGAVDESRLNGFIAALAPDRFAVLAWRHFTETGNGCDFVDDLVAGRTTLQLFPD